MSIASLGPMVVFPTDEELDRELERRRLSDEKQRSGPVADSRLAQGGLGSATDQDAERTAKQVVNFLKRVKAAQAPQPTLTAKPAPVESLEAHRRKRNQLRQRGLSAYKKLVEFEETLATCGLHIEKLS